MHSSILIATLALQTSSPPCLQDPTSKLSPYASQLLQDNVLYRQLHGYFTCVITWKLYNYNMFCPPHCSAILNLFHMALNLLSRNIKIIIFWVLKPKLWLKYRKVFKLLLMTDIFMLFSTLNSLTERIWLWSLHESFRGCHFNMYVQSYVQFTKTCHMLKIWQMMHVTNFASCYLFLFKELAFHLH